MISVIITIYNREDTLERAINSFFEQKLQEKELILIDDGSTDLSSEIAQKYSNFDNVKYYYQKNQGCAAAKNSGVNLASFDYVTFLDSDDFYDENNVLSIAAEEIHNGYEFISFQKVKMKYREFDKIVQSKENDRTNLLEHMSRSPLNYAGKPPYFFKKELFIKAGMLDESSKWGDTITFWRVFFSMDVKTKIICGLGYVYDQTDTQSMGKLNNKSVYSHAYDSILRSYIVNEKTIRSYKSEKVWQLVLLFFSLKSHSFSKIKKSTLDLLLGRFYLIPNSILYLIKTKML
ncbi:MAG: glycosyltransferase family 2 protein [Vibrio sp.]